MDLVRLFVQSALDGLEQVVKRCFREPLLSLEFRIRRPFAVKSSHVAEQPKALPTRCTNNRLLGESPLKYRRVDSALNPVRLATSDSVADPHAWFRRCMTSLAQSGKEDDLVVFFDPDFMSVLDQPVPPLHPPKVLSFVLARTRR